MRRALALSALTLGLLLPFTAQAETTGPQRFDAGKLVIRDVIGEVIVRAEKGADGITVTIYAEADELPLLSARAQDGTVTVVRSRPLEKGTKSWHLDDNNVTIRVTVPVGTPVRIDDMIGSVDLGDLDGPLTADIRAAVEIKAGRLSQASIDIAGAASIQLGDVAGKLDLSIAGAGNAEIGAVRQSADIRIAGFGDVDLASVRGDVTVRMSGVGSVDISDGHADMLDIAVSGMGGVSYDGKARDQRVSSTGLSSVRINGKKVSG